MSPDKFFVGYCIKIIVPFFFWCTDLTPKPQAVKQRILLKKNFHEDYFLQKTIVNHAILGHNILDFQGNISKPNSVL